MKKRLLLIINPQAGHGLAPEIEKHIKASGIEAKFVVDIIHTEKRGHAIEIAKNAAADGYHVVVAAGGDGTVNEVASSLMNTDTALGIIPAGSGNGLANHLNYPVKPIDALKKILNGEAIRIDTLRINNRFALNVSGFGFDGYVAWLFDRHGKRGLMSYTTISLKEYFRYPDVDFYIELDNEKLNITAHMVVIANASQFGNAAIIAPLADLKDGLADVIIVKRPPIHLMPITFYRLFNGSLRSNKFTRMVTTKKLSITASRPIHLHIDGEPNEPVKQVNMEVIPSSLSVIA